MKIHQISADHLTIEKIDEIITHGYKIELSDDAKARIVKCREYLDSKMNVSNRPIYGVTTGFGSLCHISIDADQLSQLQKNLVMSHACGTGERMPNEIVKIMMLLKIQSISYGYSGSKLDTVQRLVDFFNNDVYPIIYRQGSLGASGDLVPLAHLSLPLLGLGEVEYQGKVITGAELCQKFNWKPIELGSKEGLALLNGTQNMAAFGIWALIRAGKMLDWADRIAAMSLDAYQGLVEPFTPAVHRVRPHRGQMDTAERMRTLLEGSEIGQLAKPYVQDPYSFRCIPQVHGACKDTYQYVKSVLEVEINAATDNPTVVPEEDIIISSGNFHGEPIAQPMDFLAIALTELSNISERRIYKLVSGTRGLPSFLVANPGVNSGFMIPQYTAASLVSLSKQLSTPASVDSIPSSQGQEDHVSMGANAATKLWKVVQNTERVLAIELFNAAQALEFRRPMKSSPAIEKIFADYRRVVPFVADDTVMYPLIAASVQFLENEFINN